MKKIFLVVLALSIGVSACNQNKTADQSEKAEEKEVVKLEDDNDFLGESFDVENEIELATLITDMNSNDSVMAVVEGKVTEVCQAKGCWMKIDLPNGESMRVTFKDYGFFMPTDLAGKSVKMNGVAKIEETDVATLKHFAEDGGQSEAEIAQITEPKMDYKFIASGVKLME